MAYRQGIDKGAVLQAALDIANEQGIEQVTLAAIAAKLRVKTPSLYNHIKGLPDLRAELAVLGLTRIREAMTEAVIGKSGDDALLAVGLAYVAFARKNPGLYDSIVSGADLSNPALAEAGDQSLSFLLRILDSYKFGEEEALHVVRGLRSMMHGFASLEMKQGFQMEMDRDVSLRHLLSTYLRGLHTPGN
ncbi:WHG domain-containing protein [Paenibacillus sp. P25]|nr:WHG domain-containing protein [Paenibacillus sp. P25]